ncbi:MAG: 30S ribosomal protein S18 [Turicibacter sp.]|nr:30S ribosomal protein S18 [Turicibacter sp.]
MVPNNNKRRGRRKKRVCALCEDKVEGVNYKDVPKLRKFVSERGKILPRRITGSCSKHQRKLTMSIKRSRHMALMVFTGE